MNFYSHSLDFNKPKSCVVKYRLFFIAYFFFKFMLKIKI